MAGFRSGATGSSDQHSEENSSMLFASQIRIVFYPKFIIVIEAKVEIRPKFERTVKRSRLLGDLGVIEWRKIQNKNKLKICR